MSVYIIRELILLCYTISPLAASAYTKELDINSD